MRYYLLPLLCFIYWGYGCTSPQKQIEKKQKTTQYAEGFSIENDTSYTTVKVFDPWKKGNILATYYLIKDKQTQTPNNGTTITIPIGQIASSSVTHIGFLAQLSQLHSLTGFCKPELVYHNFIRKQAATGKITNLGDAYSIDIEKTLTLQPDILIMSGYNQSDPHAQRIAQGGVPIVYNNEWMETSPLGRAEWIKFVAAFYDQSQKADSIFEGIKNRYNTMKTKVIKNKQKPTIISGSNFRGTWYMPSGHSYMGRLYQDAQADYFYQNDTTTGSLPLGIETVLEHFAQADIWLYCNYNSIKELIEADEKHQLFKAVKSRNVYNFNKRLLPSSANDFWESAIANPDLLLGDVIAILHPEILPNWEMVYAQKLEE